ncbi:MAG: hypothetical protein ABIA21_01885 [Candidatus Aenigmatarchaeota archaeon]
MTDFFDQMKNNNIKSWYEKTYGSDKFNELVERYVRHKGYEFDAASGLFFRKSVGSEIDRRTIMDIGLPRPVDWHYHTDVDEKIEVISGVGEMLMSPFGEENSGVHRLEKGTKIVVQKERPHGFRPDKGDVIEIHLECSGILDSAKEVCLIPFYEYLHWLTYFEV